MVKKIHLAKKIGKKRDHVPKIRPKLFKNEQKFFVKKPFSGLIFDQKPHKRPGNPKFS